MSLTEVPTTAPRTAVARRPSDPAPDTLDYRVVHRAMRVDLDLLARAAAEMVERPDAQRLRLLRGYLRGMSSEILNHHTVEDEHVWPLLAALATPGTILEPLVEEHERLHVLLGQAGELAARSHATAELVTVLRQLAELIATHVDEEDREVLPRLEQHVSVADYEELQRHFRQGLDLRLLPFVVPWVVAHATPDELDRLLTSAGGPMRAVLAVAGRRFRTRRRILFWPVAATRRDRRMVAVMRRVSRIHVRIYRRSGGRIGARWLGGSDSVVLTVRGRRSGTPRTVVLMGLRDGDDLLVAASHGGVDHEPQWWLNLRADPHAEVEVRGQAFSVVAEQVADHERPELWARFVATYDGFETYQERVSRRIAVVRLRRHGGATGARSKAGAKNRANRCATASGTSSWRKCPAVLASVNEAALFIARADDPRAALVVGRQAVEALIDRLTD